MEFLGFNWTLGGAMEFLEFSRALGGAMELCGALWRSIELYGVL